MIYSFVTAFFQLILASFMQTNSDQRQHIVGFSQAYIITETDCQLISFLVHIMTFSQMQRLH